MGAHHCKVAGASKVFRKRKPTTSRRQSQTQAKKRFKEGEHNDFSYVRSTPALYQAIEKSQFLTFKVNFLCQKLSESFSIFFSLKIINLGACFLLLTFFENFNF